MEGYFGEANKLAAEGTLNSIAHFAWDVYREINKEKKDANVFFSPSSISIALMMTYLGARGNTKVEMKSALRLGLDDEDKMHEIFSELIKICDTKSKSNPAYTLLNAQRLYAQADYPFLPEFTESTRKYYHAEVQTVDFIKKGEQARNMINSWVKDQTKSKIPELISDPINTLTRLILINAVYFKGDWQSKFDATSTFADTFHINDNKAIDVNMMCQTEKFRYGRCDELHCEVVELPYVNDEITLLIALPFKGHKVDDIENQLKIDYILNRDDHFEMHKIELELYLPKFKLEDSFELSSVLGKIGMPESFTFDADFSGMDGSDKLYLDKVIHKAVLDVNEEGSEAAAATAMMMNYCMMAPLPPVVFKANRPFIFFIIHKKLNLILFMGKLVNPDNK